jgi:ComF family protein
MPLVCVLLRSVLQVLASAKDTPRANKIAALNPDFYAPEPQFSHAMNPQIEPPFVIERRPRSSRESTPTASSAASSVMQTVRIIAGATLNALAPPRCAGCGWFSPYLFCQACAPQVRCVDEGAAICECCGERLDARNVSSVDALCGDCFSLPEEGAAAVSIEKARSLWMLSGPVRHAVHDFKYLRHSDLAISLGAHMGGFARRDSVLSSAALVVPVPLHSRREWRRGFNQSALLARHTAHEMDVPCAEILRRVRHTPTQTSLSRSARDANVRAAFAVQESESNKYLQARSVDDVWTTGATLRECARALHKAGFERVCALTLARRGK